MCVEKEIWKDIVGFEGFYQVSNEGRIKSLGGWRRSKNDARQYRHGKILKQGQGERGYLMVSLCKDGSAKTSFVHRLVAQAFILPLSADKRFVNHVDGNPSNNHVENLEWVTQSENILHAVRIGLKQTLKGECGITSKLKSHQVLEIVQKYKTKTQVELAAEYGVSHQNIHAIISGLSWSHLTGINRI